MGDVEFVEQRVELVLALALVRLDHLEDRADVLLDGQAAEDRGLLRQVADAEAGAPVHRQPGDVVAVELDAAVVGLDQPGDHVEDGGLAGAVRAEQADRLAAPHIKRDALHHGAAGEAFLHTVRGEVTVAHGLAAVDVAALALRHLLLLRRRGIGLPRLHRQLMLTCIRRRPACAGRLAPEQREDIHRMTSRRVVWSCLCSCLGRARQLS